MKFDGTITATPVSEHVMRVDYDAAGATELPLRHSTIRLADRWKVLVGRATSQLEEEHVGPPRLREHLWWGECGNCPPEELWLAIDQPVAGFRVRWTFGDRTRDWVEAASRHDVDNGAAIVLGNCGGDVLPYDEVYEGGTLELVAIRFDGTEVPVEGVPEWLQLESGRRWRFRAEDSSDDDDHGAVAIVMLLAMYAAYRVWLGRVTASS